MNAAARLFLGVTLKSLFDLQMGRKSGIKITINHTLFPERKLVEGFVGGLVLRWQTAGMNRVMPRRLKQGAQTGWQVRVHHEFHESVR